MQLFRLQSVSYRISEAEWKIQKKKLDYETACNEMKALFEERNIAQAGLLFKAMAKSDKSI